MFALKIFGFTSFNASFPEVVNLQDVINNFSLAMNGLDYFYLEHFQW